jgi:hypothetical protein
MTAESRSLEERVAALEEMTAHPLQMATAPELTEEQAREFEREFQGALGRAQKLHILPPRQPLTEDEVRQLLRECVTVVRPGEVLILRVGPPGVFTPDQLREYQDSVTWWLDHNAPGVQALVVIGEDGQIVRQEPAGLVHQSPGRHDGGLMPCCGLTPFEAPDTDRMTLEPSQVTCKVPSRAPRHLHPAGEPAAEDLFTHMSQAHSMYMTGFSLPDMAKIHDALHAPQHVAAAGG